MRIAATCFAITLIGILAALAGGQTAPATRRATSQPASQPAASQAAATEPETKPRRKILIGVVAKSTSNTVFQAAHTGAIDAANFLSDKYDVDIKLDIRTPQDEDPRQQSQAVEALTREGAHGILISCSYGDDAVKAIDGAVAAGVAVVCFDSDSPKSKRLAFYGSDDVAIGAALAKQLAKSMGNKGVVAILAGYKDAPNLQNRIKGLEKELANYPDIKLLDTGPVYHEETPDRSAQAMQQTQTAHPNITGWALIGGWPLFTQDALKWKPADVKVVSVDALMPQIMYVQKGQVDALLAHDCYGWGYKSVQILLEKIVNHKDPRDKIIVEPLTIITKDNADEYAKKWEKWLRKR